MENKKCSERISFLSIILYATSYFSLFVFIISLISYFHTNEFYTKMLIIPILISFLVCTISYYFAHNIYKTQRIDDNYNITNDINEDNISLISSSRKLLVFIKITIENAFLWTILILCSSFLEDPYSWLACLSILSYTFIPKIDKAITYIDKLEEYFQNKIKQLNN